MATELLDDIQSLYALEKLHYYEIVLKIQNKVNIMQNLEGLTETVHKQPTVQFFANPKMSHKYFINTCMKCILNVVTSMNKPTSQFFKVEKGFDYLVLYIWRVLPM